MAETMKEPGTRRITKPARFFSEQKFAMIVEGFRVTKTSFGTEESGAQ